MACKISGLVTEADHAAWIADGLAPYVGHGPDQFGEDRVMYGGAWPVATQGTTYRRRVETLNGLTVPLSPEGRRKLWSENARRFYRLG